MVDVEYPGEHRYNGMVLHRLQSEDNIKAIKDLQTDPNDICIASYPKCGTTWMCKILTQIYPEVCNIALPLPVNVPNVEFDGTLSNDPLQHRLGNGLEHVKSRNSPRLMYTHMPANYWKDKVENNRLKVVMVVRNIKDQMTSYLHFHQKASTYFIPDITMGILLEKFKTNNICLGNFFSFFESWYDLRELPNVMVIRYEDMKSDLVKEITKISRFCGKSYTEAQISDMARNSEFAAMQKDPMANYYGRDIIVRKGLVGEWRKYLTNEQSQYLDDVSKFYPHYRKLYPEISGL